MDISLLFKGVAVGLVVAVPIGPIGLLCTKRILTSGRMHGLVSGLGAATADAIFASLSAFGLTLISGFMVQQNTWFRLFAGVFISLLGIRAVLVKREKTPGAPGLVDKLCHFNNYASTLLISLSNPMSLLVIAGLFAGLNVTGLGAQRGNGVLLVGGVFLGSMFWWTTLSIFVGMFHKRLGDETLVKLARVFGVILTIFGITLIVVTILQIGS
jgi:threonine/homoserine/homoserine lactone efflux protein